jgi:hypothetical protein
MPPRTCDHLAKDYMSLVHVAENSLRQRINELKEKEKTDSVALTHPIHSFVNNAKIIIPTINVHYEENAVVYFGIDENSNEDEGYVVELHNSMPFILGCLHQLEIRLGLKKE